MIYICIYIYQSLCVCVCYYNIFFYFRLFSAKKERGKPSENSDDVKGYSTQMDIFHESKCVSIESIITLHVTMSLIKSTSK